MTPDEAARYADAIFGFCLRRLNAIEEAHDLAQEILCEILSSLPHTQIDHPDAWVWGVARNCFLRHLRSKKQRYLLMDDGALEMLAVPEKEDLSEECRAAFEALHTLAASHRDVMVDFYVSSLTCNEIALKRGLTPETVRSRLFYGREKLRKRWPIKMEENRIYQRNEWFPTGNGDVNPSLMMRQIVRSIIEACGGQFQTIDQLSLATGIPAMYIEDEMDALINAGAIERQNGRFRAGMIVHQAEFAEHAEAFLLEHARQISPFLKELLDKCLPGVRAIGFHGADLPKDRLCWSLIPILMREAITLARSADPELVRGDFPLRPDGSRGWLCAYRSPTGSRRYFSGCNTYFRDGSRFRYFWSHDLYSEELSRVLMKLEYEHIRDTQVAIEDELLLAECIRCDLIARREGALQWNIPVFTADEAQQLLGALHSATEAMAQKLLPAVKGLHQMMKEEIPAHLHDQIKGVFGIECNAVIAMLCELLLPKPEAEPFAGQVMMLLEDASALKL